MNPRIIAPVLLLFGLWIALMLGGCPAQRHNGKLPSATAGDQIVVFFSKSRGTQSVTEGVVRPKPKTANEAEQLVAYAVQELLKGPKPEESTQGFYSEIPKGTHLLDVKEQQDTLRVNLSGQFTSGGGSNSVQQRLAELTRTIFAAANQNPQEKKKVYISVEGKTLQILGGEGLEVKQPLEQAVQ